jgi:hypothetical protein
MSLLFLVPSAGYGLYLFISQGNPILLIMSVVMVLIYSQTMKYRDISKDCSVSFLNDRVYLGDRRLPLLVILWPAKIRNRVFEAAFRKNPRELLMNLRIEDHGVNLAGDGVSLEPSDKSPHGIIIGPTGCGKTQLMRAVVNSFQGEIWAVDFKGGSGFRDFRNLAKLASEPDAQKLALEIKDLIAHRQRQMFSESLLLVVDELGEVMRHRELAQAIELVAAKGRSLGVFLLCANQTLSQVPRTIWVNCAIRVVIRADPVDAAQLGLKSATEFDLPNDLRMAAADISGFKTQFYFQIGREINSRTDFADSPIGKNPSAFPVLEFHNDALPEMVNFRL